MLGCICLLYGSCTFAQHDHPYWAQLVDYDGFSPWQSYLNMAPAFMGPNALPVPLQHQGRIKKSFETTLRAELHLGQGDLTYNPYTRVYVPLGQGRVALEGQYVPWESYRLSDQTRDLRRARSSDARGTAAGDVYLSTLVKLTEQKGFRPDLLLGIHLKTASGTDLHNARYTDAPGYYFDVSWGWELLSEAQSSLWQMRGFGMLGFYAWQTHNRRYLQNDAFLYGLGFALSREAWIFRAEWAGYVGYIDEGDRPMVLRFAISRQSGTWRPELLYRVGLQDYPFHSLGLGLVVGIPVNK